MYYNKNYYVKKINFYLFIYEKNIILFIYL